MPYCSVLILKTASRCNLNCSYCYVYNAGDETYREQPRFMSSTVVDELLERVAEHIAEHDLASFGFVFHGGEPMLADRDFYRSFVSQANSALGGSTRLDFALQTNGTLVDEDWCDLLNELGVRLSISIDGPPRIHDRFRVDHAGNGSYERVRTGITAAVNLLDTSPGLLAVIDPASDPDEAWEHVLELDVAAVGFLLPDVTHDSAPPGVGSGSTEYGDWLIRVFDRWYEAGGRVSVKVFEEFVASILGYQTTRHGIAKSKAGVLVIETNGDIEPVDYMKVCQPGITKIGANVRTHTLSEVFEHPLIAAYYDAAGHASGICRSCAIFDVCGGGQLVHRWSSDRGFDNPSVYCLDLMKLIVHIQNRVVSDLPSSVVERTGVGLFTFDEARESISVPVDGLGLVKA